MPGGNRLVNSAGGDCLRYGYCQPAADAAGLTCGEQRCRAWDKLSQQQPTSSLYFGFNSCNRQQVLPSFFKAAGNNIALQILGGWLAGTTVSSLLLFLYLQQREKSQLFFYYKKKKKKTSYIYNAKTHEVQSIFLLCHHNKESSVWHSIYQWSWIAAIFLFSSFQSREPRALRQNLGSVDWDV